MEGSGRRKGWGVEGGRSKDGRGESGWHRAPGDRVYDSDLSISSCAGAWRGSISAEGVHAKVMHSIVDCSGGVVEERDRLFPVSQGELYLIFV